MNSNDITEEHEGQKGIFLRLRNEEFRVYRLDDYSFEIDAPKFAVELSDASEPLQENVALVGAGVTLPVSIRVRHIDDGRVRFAFHDISLTERESLKKLQKTIEDLAKDELHKLSYDELANGGSPTVSGALEEKCPPQQPSGQFRSLAKKLAAICVMFLAIAGVILWLTLVVNSHATVEVLNGVVIGNYLPINSPQQSVLMEILVKPGQEVQKGDVLARMSSTLVSNEVELIGAKLRRAESELRAYRAEADQLKSTLQFAELKIDRDFGVVEAEIQRAQAMLKSAEAQLKRLEPLISRGNIAVAEYDAANALLATAKAELVRQAAMKESLTVAKRAAQSNVIVTAHGVANPMSELDTKITVAEAAIRELQETESTLKAASVPIEILAPESGVVYAIYRNQGETVKVADQLMAINVEGSNWAMGSVDINLATRIRHGHPVSVDIPSLGITTTGTIVGIGPRSLYGIGGFHSEFRSTPVEVPIRIALDMDGHHVPSGLRLNMVVRVKEPIKDFKNWVQKNIIDSLAFNLQKDTEESTYHSPDSESEVPNASLVQQSQVISR